MFISDVELFKKLNDPSARQTVAEKIFQQFCAPEAPDHVDGLSVFSRREDELPWYAGRKASTTTTHTKSEVDLKSLSLLTEGTNTIGVYGRAVTTLEVLPFLFSSKRET